jgi:hypothetical protein
MDMIKGVRVAVELTDEMRHAVHLDDCARLGHQIDLNTVFSMEGSRARIQGPDASKIAHLLCMHCGQVWMVIEEPGSDYLDAENKLKARMKDPSTVQPQPRTSTASGS